MVHNPYQGAKEIAIQLPVPQTASLHEAQSKSWLLWRVVIPRYAMPLMISVAGSMMAMTGFAPTFLYLHSFKLAPKGDLNYQLNCKSLRFFRIDL
jgi:hypothetical protein